MENNQPKRYIPPPPQDKKYNAIIWGDLSIARFIDVEELENTYKFSFAPTEDMKHKHQIQYWEYDKNRAGIISKEFPKDKCYLVSASPIGWFILCNYKNIDIKNNLVNQINNIILESNREFLRQISSFKILLAKQSYEHKLQIKHQESKYDEMIQRMKKAKEVVGATTEIISPESQEEKKYEPR